MHVSSCLRYGFTGFAFFTTSFTAGRLSTSTMTGTAAADPVADGAGAQAPATVVPPGMRSGPWNSYDRVQLEDAVMVARIAGASQVRLIRPGYATIEIDLKHEKAAGDRESVQAAERSYVERTAPKKKELTDEQLAARTASRKAKKIRQNERRAKEAGERAASEAERAARSASFARRSLCLVFLALRAAAFAASCSLVSSFFFGAVRSMYERSAACTDARSPAAFSCFRSTSMVA